jgi:hypothetical protein
MYATNSWTASVERRAAVDGARSQNLSNPALKVRLITRSVSISASKSFMPARLRAISYAPATGGEDRDISERLLNRIYEYSP